MIRKVFIQVPSNKPSGGIKVAHQIVNLFREHNYEAYIVLPDEVYQADWLIKPAQTINIPRMETLCKNNDIIIDNWSDRSTTKVTMELPARTKVFYMQGCTFFRSKNLIGDDYFKYPIGYTHFWVVSKDSMDYLKKRYPDAKYPPNEKWYLVNPYFEFESVKEIIVNIERKNRILAFSRKGKSYINLAKIFYKNKIGFDIIDKFTEKQAYELYASHKYFLSTAVGIDPLKQRLFNVARFLKHRNTTHNVRVISPKGRREGFILPPTEAMMCGSIVIGFAMGSGMEWMSPSTCFLSKDRSYSSLMKKIKEALITSDTQLNNMRENALRSISKFNKKHTWQQIKAFLKEECHD